MAFKGGDWDILGGERIRRWPDNPLGGKREITVKMSSWRGISFGAKHIYVEIEEQKNQFWSEQENAWVEIIQDSENRGYSMRAEVMDENEGEKLITYFLRMIKTKNHVVKRDNIL